MLFMLNNVLQAEQIREAYQIAQRLNMVGPLMEQPQYNMLHRTRVERCFFELLLTPAG